MDEQWPPSIEVCELRRLMRSASQVKWFLAGAISCTRPNGHARECNLLSFLKDRTAGRKFRFVHFDRLPSLDIHRQQPPLRRSSSPNIGGIAATGNGKRHTMKRLRSLFSCHPNQPIFSPPRVCNSWNHSASRRDWRGQPRGDRMTQRYVRYPGGMSQCATHALNRATSPEKAPRAAVKGQSWRQYRTSPRP